MLRHPSCQRKQKCSLIIGIIIDWTRECLEQNLMQQIIRAGLELGSPDLKFGKHITWQSCLLVKNNQHVLGSIGFWSLWSCLFQSPLFLNKMMTFIFIGNSLSSLVGAKLQWYWTCWWTGNRKRITGMICDTLMEPKHTSLHEVDLKLFCTAYFRTYDKH